MTAAGELGLGGSPASPITTFGFSDFHQEWAPDGSLIYFSSLFRPGTPSGRECPPRSDRFCSVIFSVDPAVGEPATQVTPNEGTNNRQPAVSPDGRTLAFVSIFVSTSGSGFEIVLQDLATGEHTIVLLEPPVGESLVFAGGLDLEQNLEFSPDGKRILFSDGSDIFVADVSKVR